MISDKKLILRNRPHLSKASRRRLEDVSWVTEYPNAVQSLNSAIRLGKNEVEPYSLVFGMRYEDPIMSGLYVNPDSKNHKTIMERAEFLGGDYEDRMKLLKEIPDDDIKDKKDTHAQDDIIDNNDGDYDTVKTNLFGKIDDNMKFLERNDWSRKEDMGMDPSETRGDSKPAAIRKTNYVGPSGHTMGLSLLQSLKSPPVYQELQGTLQSW
jgi:hypothetical protein